MDDHRQVLWVCPLCRAVSTGGDCGDDSRKRDSLCSSCRLRPDWEALPQAVRDEVGAMVGAAGRIRAGYLLMDLDGNRRPPLEYMMLTSYRASVGERTCSCTEAEYGHVSWTCPSCDRPLTGCDHNRGDTCRPCLSAPDWETLSQAVRDEVGAMVGAGDVMSAAYRLRDLDDNRLNTFDYVLMTVHVQDRDPDRKPA